MVRCARLADDPARPLNDEVEVFPPKTRKVQLDEKNQANCDPYDPADDQRSDGWDHVAIDPEIRLVLVVVPGPRDVEGVE